MGGKMRCNVSQDDYVVALTMLDETTWDVAFTGRISSMSVVADGERELSQITVIRDYEDDYDDSTSWHTSWFDEVLIPIPSPLARSDREVVRRELVENMSWLEG